MRSVRLVLSWSVAIALAGGTVWAAGPSPAPRFHGQAAYPPGYCLPVPCPTPTPKEEGKEAEPPRPEPVLPADAFAQAPEAGPGAGETANPGMFGDLIGPCTLVSLARARGSSVTSVVVAPVASRGAFKIADNESPRPINRVFFNYNFFSNVLNPISGPGVTNTDLHREVIGFERTFFNGNASFGMRLPFLQITGFDEVQDSFVGDLTFITKFAFINNLETNNVLSGGLVVTAPTGEDNLLLGPVHSTLIQPWGGFIYNLGALYVHGFSSIVIPTNSADATIWFNDLGAGVWLLRNGGGFLTGIVPTGEIHINTPLNNGNDECTDFIDSVNLTGGVYWMFGQRLIIGTAVGVPVTGPKPYDIEAIANVNFRF